MKHWHHIIPTHAGGPDTPDNKVLLSLEEHAEAHRKLWLEYGRWEDWVAWQGLASMIPHQEAIRIAKLQGAARGGKKPKRREVQRANGSKLWATPEMRAHISEKRREQSRIGKNPMQGKKHARACCLCCRKEFGANVLKNHQRMTGFSVAE